MKTNCMTRTLWAVLAVFVLLLSFSNPIPASASAGTQQDVEESGNDLAAALDFCAGGNPVKQQLYFDDIESGTANWIFGALEGDSMWELSAPNEDPASGEYALHAVPTAIRSDSYAAMLSGVTVPAGVNTFLYFSHDFGFEWGAAYYDGGVLEYSLDGGAWQDAGILFDGGTNYGGTIGDPSYDNPLKGRPGFVGESITYTQSRYNLTSLVGHTVLFRWRVGTDNGIASPRGWFVDDVAIYTCDIITIDDLSNSVKYDGWTGVADILASSGGYHTASLAADSLVYKTTVKSKSFTLLTYMGPDQGKAQVVVDGKVKQTPDLYSATPAYTSIPISGLTLAIHTITVKVLGQKNALSTGTAVRVDGFIVGTTTIDEKNVAVKYTSWSAASNTLAFGGSYRYSAVTNAKATFQFTGTTFTWITAKGKTYGKAGVYVDGVLNQTVDLYSATPVWQYKVTVSGLPSGVHTVEVKVTGTKNARSTGKTVVFDAYLGY